MKSCFCHLLTADCVFLAKLPRAGTEQGGGTIISHSVSVISFCCPSVATKSTDQTFLVVEGANNKIQGVFKGLKTTLWLEDSC